MYTLPDRWFSLIESELSFLGLQILLQLSVLLLQRCPSVGIKTRFRCLKRKCLIGLVTRQDTSLEEKVLKKDALSKKVQSLTCLSCYSRKWYLCHNKKIFAIVGSINLTASKVFPLTNLNIWSKLSKAKLVKWSAFSKILTLEKSKS